MDPIETQRPPESRCPTCQRPVDPPGPFGMWTPGRGCQNPICDHDDREFGCCYAIALDEPPLRGAIRRYKYGHVGNAHQAALELAVTLAHGLLPLGIPIRSYDLVIGMPAFIDDESERQFAHVDLVLEKLNTLTDDPLPTRLYDESPIRKTARTDTMARRSWHERERIAIYQLRPALQVADPALVAGQSVLVVDDIFTTGHSLREVARALRLAGASSVDGLVLARAVYGR